MAAVTAPAAPAFAHNTVIDEGPAADSTIAEQPGEVWVETNDVLLDVEGATAIDVVGPDGRHYATACATVDGAIASVPAELGPAGEYTVAYRVVSADGHPITGDHTFEWAPGDGEALADGAAEAVCGAGSGSGSGEDAAGPDEAVGGADEATDAAASTGGSDLVWIVAAAVVVIGAGVAAFALTRRSRPGEQVSGASPDGDAPSDDERPEMR
jgi:methionine-rich copper-binding protein CopC